MREIKFRGWDSTGEFMFDSEFFRCGPSKGPAGVLLQFTGLKDKTGKEIYEGDIVRWRFSHGNPWRMMTETVEYRDGAFYPVGWHNAEHMDVEVIGNIYENPELLSLPEQSK